MNSYNKGLWSEWFAALYLMGKGFRIRARRYKTPVGEIDIIASTGRTLVFIEVKTRPNINEALEAISPRSRPRLIRAAKYYLAAHAPAQPWETLRFDLIALAPPFHMRHLDNIFPQAA